MLELLALALFQFATLVSSPTTNAAAKGGSSGWNDGNVPAASAVGGSSGWNDGNLVGGSSGWNDGNLVGGSSGWNDGN